MYRWIEGREPSVGTVDDWGRFGRDLDAAERLWDEVGDTPEPEVAPVWLHGDMRRANLLSHAGRLAGVIDFGTLSIGRPAAEHAAVWDLPRSARDAYRARLHLDDDAWTLARGWCLLPSLAGLPYYRETWPEFARLCRDRIEVLTTTVD